MNNEIDLSAMGMAIKDTDAEPTANKDNNKIDVEVNGSVFIGEVINKVDIKFDMCSLGGPIRL